MRLTQEPVCRSNN